VSVDTEEECGQGKKKMELHSDGSSETRCDVLSQAGNALFLDLCRIIR
jgi:hypothetical protein